MTHDGMVLYAYGFVRADFDAARAPVGVDDSKVTLVHHGSIGALVTRLPAAEYASDSVEAKSGDVAWLSPRAMAHDLVLTWAQEHGGVIPLPMFSLWGSEGALAATLSDRAPQLSRVFERTAGADEFGLRVHRRDSVMLEAIDDLDPQMAQLRRDAQAASPGQRYLLERKLADQGKGAVRAASHRMAQQIFDELKAIARDAIARPLTPQAAGAGSARVPDATLVLNGAFLVDRTRLDAFRGAVGTQVREHQPRGLSFDFTGPWPPYNFVGDGSVRRGGDAE